MASRSSSALLSQGATVEDGDEGEEEEEVLEEDAKSCRARCAVSGRVETVKG